MVSFLLNCSVTSTDEIPGSGAVYSFDPVGSYEREACRAAGAAQSLVQPFLDNQVIILFSRGGGPEAVHRAYPKC
jgi:20S proteasome alpha/beta subunit